MPRYAAPVLLLMLSLAAVDSARAAPRGLAKLCASLFGHAPSTRALEFEATLEEMLDGHLGENQAEWVGSRILQFPQIYLKAVGPGRTSPLVPFLSSPGLASRFFAAHPDNGLVAGDLLALAPGLDPGAYRDPLAPALRALVTAPAAEVDLRHPAFDVAREQAHALDLMRWLGVTDAAVIEAAFGFLDPKLTRFKRGGTLRSLGARAYAAADFIHRRTREREISPERIEWLVTQALLLGHPFRTHYWVALVPEVLNAGQIERLAGAWATPVLLESERDEMRARAERLVELVENQIRHSPRKYKHLRTR